MSRRGFKASSVEIFHFAAGQVVERWGLTDDMSILGQLGLVPAPHQRRAMIRLRAAIARGAAWSETVTTSRGW